MSWSLSKPAKCTRIHCIMEFSISVVGDACASECILYVFSSTCRLYNVCMGTEYIRIYLVRFFHPSAKFVISTTTCDGLGLSIII